MSTGPPWRSRRLATAAVAAATLVLLGLGTWQAQRLYWKRALIEARTTALALPPLALPGDAAAMRGIASYRRVEVRGRYLHVSALRFPARIRAGRVGVELVVPLRRAGGAVVLVNRGWLPDGAPPAREVETGEVVVVGLLRRRGAQGWFTPDNQPESNEWYWYDVSAMAAQFGLDAPPVVIEAGVDGDSPRLPRGRAFAVAIANNHLQYAITWYALAVALLAMTWIARRRQRADGGA